MKTILGGLLRLFYTANKTHLIRCSAFLIYLILLTLLHHRWKDDGKKLKYWQRLSLLLLPASVIHYLIYDGGCHHNKH